MVPCSLETTYKFTKSPISATINIVTLSIGFGVKKCKLILDKYPNILDLEINSTLVNKLEMELKESKEEFDLLLLNNNLKSHNIFSI